MIIMNYADVGTGRCQKDPEIAKKAWIFSMWISTDSRRLGAGTGLIDDSIPYARSINVTRLLLDVRNDAKAACETLQETRI